MAAILAIMPNLGIFCIKGLVTSDREIYPKYWEVKKVYQPVTIAPVNLKPGKVAIKVTNRNSFLNLSEYEARWSVTDSDGKELQSGVLGPIDCAPGKQAEIKIPVEQIRNPKPGAEFWLRVSFHTKTDSLWAKAGYEIAWQQMKLEVKTPAIPKIKTSDLPTLKFTQNLDAVQIQGTNFTATFNRAAGTLTSLIYDGHQMISQAKDFPGGPILQVWRAPTDNDKGFGKWLATRLARGWFKQLGPPRGFV